MNNRGWKYFSAIFLLSFLISFHAGAVENGEESEKNDDPFPGMQAVYIRPEPLEKEAIEEYMQNIAQWGAEEVFIEVNYNNRTLHHSDIFPVRDSEKDWFEKLVEAARENDLAVHAWIKVCYWVHTEEALDDFDILQENPHWKDINREGEYLSEGGTYEEEHFIYVNPAVPGVRQATHSYIEELMQYDIDGISIDYIRFKATREDPQYWYGYNPYSVEKFKGKTGIDPLEIEPDISNEEFIQWIEYNEEMLAELVGSISAVIHRLNEQMEKDVILSASPFTGYETGKDSKMQNWFIWDEEQYIDLWLPMCMSVDMEDLRKEVEEVQAMGLNAPEYPVIYPGQHGVLHPPMQPHYEVMKETGVDKFAVFSYKQLKEEYKDTGFEVD